MKGQLFPAPFACQKLLPDLKCIRNATSTSVEAKAKGCDDFDGDFKYGECKGEAFKIEQGSQSFHTFFMVISIFNFFNYLRQPIRWPGAFFGKIGNLIRKRKTSQELGNFFLFLSDHKVNDKKILNE